MTSRRDFLTGSAIGAVACGLGGACATVKPVSSAVPSLAQRRWQELEIGMFFHYDIPIFAPGWKWDSFKDIPSPDVYNPAKLDTDQWMEAAKAIGAKYVIFTAKHCSGFLQWQSDAYDYGLRQSKWRNGKGDVVKDFIESARRYGMIPGLYASVSANAYWGVNNPGAVNHGKGGDVEAQRRYAKVCEKMATELWSRYGELGEIWFDGGVLSPEQGGPDLYPIIERYQPNAILFQGPEQSKNLIRWIGNELAVAPYPCWGSTNVLTDSDGIAESSFPGHPDGQYWAPGECDVPMRKHAWFWGECEGKWRYWSDKELMSKYLSSVGRNCNLLLNANPSPDGLIIDCEMEQYRRFGAAIRKRFSNPLASVAGEGEKVEIEFAEPTQIDQLVVSEDIRFGHRVRAFVIETKGVDGKWYFAGDGLAIGHKYIQVIPPTMAKAVRLRITSAMGRPEITNFAAFNTRG